MSASGELRAIDDAANAHPYGRDNDLHGEPLLCALPQIAALAEAAEEVGDQFFNTPERYVGTQMASLRAALTALEKALVSWRE